MAPVDTHPGSTKLYDESRQYLAGGVTSHFRLGESPVPLFFRRASGSHLYDVDGHRYIDYAMGMGPVILGHANPAVNRAVADSLDDGQLYAGQHPREVELARRIVEVIPCAQSVRFGMSGSEMVQAAIRVARATTGRSLIAKFDGHYHGWMDSVYVSGAPDLGEPSTGGGWRPVPQSRGQSTNVTRDIAVLPWNDPAALTDFMKQRGHELAALLMEPVMCNTCVIPPAQGYLELARALTASHGALLVFDEVITGFRLGIGGAQQRLGVTPDLAVFAKALGNGFPIALLGGSAATMDVLASGDVVHGGTYNGCVPSIAAGLATLDELTRDGGAILRDIEKTGESLMERLRDAADEIGSPLVVQGYGSVFSTHFARSGAATDYRSYQMSDASLQQRFLDDLRRAGVRPTRRGTWFLSSAHDALDIDETVAIVRSVLTELRAN